jgi:hypothetical protein
MKTVLAIIGLMVCSIAHADLESSSQKLSICVTSYAESQIKTTKQAHSIAEESFDKCSVELSEVHDSIGPDKSQWDVLSAEQKQAISKIRGRTTQKIHDQISSQIVTFVTESRKRT